MRFHLLVAKTAQNEVLKNAVQLLRNVMRQWLYYKVLIPNVPPAVLESAQDHLSRHRRTEAQYRPFGDAEAPGGDHADRDAVVEQHEVRSEKKVVKARSVPAAAGPSRPAAKMKRISS